MLTNARLCTYVIGMMAVNIIWKGVSLTKVSCEKDLGVWISDDMKCSKQCMYAFNKTTRVLYWV